MKKRLNLCGEQVRRVRRERGLSIVQMQVLLAQRGLTLDLGKLERGQRRIHDCEFALLAHVLDVPLERLMWGGEPPDKNQFREIVRMIDLRSDASPS